MLDPHPRQDQEARVVSDKADAGPPPPCIPADVAIATTKMARSRRPGQARDGTAFSPHNILKVFANRLLIAKVVMFLHQAVKQRLMRGAPHLLRSEERRV